MSLIHLPVPPLNERRSVKQRILRKYEVYRNREQRNALNDNQERGERYEIAVAIHLYRNHLLTRADYLSRWHEEPEDRQHIYVGLNNEYDFLLDAHGGLLIGDAKSDSRELGAYTKKAASFCLYDRYVLHRETIQGWCFATPTEPAHMFLRTLRNVLEVVSGASEAAGITGLNSQLIPSEIKLHFWTRYIERDGSLRANKLTGPPDQYLAELREKAKLTFEFIQVPMISREALAKEIRALEAKERWARA
jgi:hypothetical protein